MSRLSCSRLSLVGKAMSFQKSLSFILVSVLAFSLHEKDLRAAWSVKIGLRTQGTVKEFCLP